MKMNGNEIKPGNIIKHQDTLWVAVKCNAVKPGKGGAFNQVELKNLLDGRKLNERFRSAETVERIRLDQKTHTYLYPEGDMLVFMNAENYEQIYLQADFVGDQALYLTDGMEVEVEFYEERPITVALPEQVILTVEETEPVVKGQTSANSFKPATLSNGARTNVPPFVDAGERLVINTNDGSYVKRAD
ncbi:elongation factor P [Litorimonas cladophorae]|jgi:elongation factor P|uniref:Elongation factor P n=1 Tax=Litorimonas cladophorae TaxID=1220491 RepID=A0A918KN37_9PROT|nr:elongation factor P [Litorimonas cladophorae]GGX69241.1 elongation factor P [Litorimonas cladophorae]